MDRRLLLQALTSATACTVLPAAALAAPLPLPSPPPEGAESGAPKIAPDPLCAQAVAVVMTHNKASIALVQRHLKLGYNRAARLLDSMEQASLISSFDIHGRRHILAPGFSSEFIVSPKQALTNLATTGDGFAKQS